MASSSPKGIWEILLTFQMVSRIAIAAATETLAGNGGAVRKRTVLPFRSITADFLRPIMRPMKIQRRKIGVVLVLANIAVLFFVHKLTAQAEPQHQEVEARVVLSKLFPPIYPPLARQARVSGDVHLKVSIYSDGSIHSVTVIDGPPMLQQAAQDSAKQSRFDCEHCGGSGLIEKTFTYSFQIPGREAVSSSCCLEEQAPADKSSTAPVSQSGDRITITTPAICVCSDEILETLMDRRMRIIAGNDALDCGRVKLDGDPKASLKCAHQAISKKRAFFVRSRVQAWIRLPLTGSLAMVRAKYTASTSIAWA